MKKLSLFLTLSLLTLIGTSTVVVVKAELERSQKPTPDSAIISPEADAADAAEPPTTEAEYLEEPQSELNTIEDEKQKAEAGAEPEPEAEQSVPAE